MLQFVEIKGSVFKKFEKNDLFQMSCSDVRERFHYVLLLAIVCIRNMAEFNWNPGMPRPRVCIFAIFQSYFHLAAY